MDEKPSGTDDSQIWVTLFGDHNHEVNDGNSKTFFPAVNQERCTRVALETLRWQTYDGAEMQFVKSPNASSALSQQPSFKDVSAPKRAKGRPMQVTPTMPLIKVEPQEPKKVTKDLHGWKVLLVDDDGPTRVCINAQLKKAGAEVTQFKDGSELMEHVRANPGQKYDACLMDELMPTVNGTDALRSLREEDFQVKTVLMSGSLPQEEKPEGLMSELTLDNINSGSEVNSMRMKFRIAGADSTIAKPVRMDSLMQTLKRLDSGVRSPLAPFSTGKRDGHHSQGRGCLSPE